jgi:hypothetical protein
MEKYKDVEINGRKFRIRKFPARTGAFVLIKVTGMIAPFFKGANLADLKSGITDATAIAGIMEKLGDISESDFNYLQEKCLGVCSEVLPGGLAPVLNENGTFGVIDFEEDVIGVLALTAHALMFNLYPVFQGAGLGSILGAASNTFPRN